MLRLATLALAACLIFPASARAEGELWSKDNLKRVFSAANREMAWTMMGNAFKRFRRAWTLGPSVSAAGVVRGGDEMLDGSFGLGVGILHYEIPMLISEDRFAEILMDRVAAAVYEKLRSDGIEAPSLEQVKQMGKALAEDIRDELMLELQASHFEKPSFAFVLEGERFFREEAWVVRTTYGYGIGPVFASLGLGFNFADEFTAFAHGEIALPILLSKGLNSPVVDAFARLDIFMHNRDTSNDRYQVGARFFFDAL
jgi:hypothetical protein